MSNALLQGRVRKPLVSGLVLGAALSLLTPASTEEQTPPPSPAATPAPAASRQDGPGQGGTGAPAARVPFPTMPEKPAPAWENLPASVRNKRLSLDFRGADIDNVLKFFSMAAGVTIAKDAGLKGPVTMISAKKLTLSEAFHILEAVLNSKGYKLAWESPVLRAVPAGQQQPQQSQWRDMWRSFEPQVPTNEIRVFPLQHADAQQVARIVNELFQMRGGQMFAAMAAAGMRMGRPGGFPGQPGGAPGQPGGFPGQPGGFGGMRFPGMPVLPDVRASADDYTNSVVVNANPEYMSKVESLIRELDKQVDSTMQTRVFPLEYASATELADTVASVLLATAPGLRTAASQTTPFEQRVRGGGGGRVALYAVRTQVVPNERTNSLVVTATPENLKLVEQVIKELDKPVEYETTTYVLPLSSAQATEVATLLNQALRGSGGYGYYGGYGGYGQQRYGSTNYRRQGNQGYRPSTRPTGGSTRPFGRSATSRAANLDGAEGADDQAGDRAPDGEGSEAPDDEGEAPTSRQFPMGQGGGFRGGTYSAARSQQRIGRGEQGRVVNLLDLAGQVVIVPDANTNSLIINTTPENLEAIREILKQLDVVPEQVLIEAVVAEARLDAATKLGIEWSWSNKADGRTVTANTNLPDADLALGPAFKFSVVGKSLDAVLNTLSSDQRFNVLSTPRICTTNNRQAQINISQSVPYVMDVRETESGTRTYSIGYLDVGIILDVTPHITKDGLVNIEVTQQANELQGFTTFQAPMVSQRQATTTITVRDGETIILGGMIRDQKDKTVRKVPVLGDLPLIGGLFRSLSNSTAKTELMVFLTPRVIRDPAQAAALTELQKQEIKVRIPPPPGSLPEGVQPPAPGSDEDAGRDRRAPEK